MHDFAVFLKHLAIVLGAMIVGIGLGGLWMIVGPFVLGLASGAGARTPLSDPAVTVEAALNAEWAFVTDCPRQEAAVRWWSWSPSPWVIEPTEADTTSVAGKVLGGLSQPVNSWMARVASAASPWLRLVWIRGIAALAVLVAAVLPALALWTAGRRRAHVLLHRGAMASSATGRLWEWMDTMLAVAAGILIGAPIAIAMIPWITLALLGSLALLGQVRACMTARL
jgi:hypothetical protein